MKIHQNASESNISFALAQNIHQIPSNDNKTSELMLVDRTNRLRTVVLDDTNIIILSEDPDQALDLSLHIQKYCARNERLTKIISLKEFSNLPLGKQNTADFIHVIVGSAGDLSITTDVLLRQFTNIFIFQLPDLKIACSYSGHTKSTPDFDEICLALGGDKFSRKYLLSTLNKHEFLAITGEDEAICILKNLGKTDFIQFKKGPQQMNNKKPINNVCYPISDRDMTSVIKQHIMVITNKKNLDSLGTNCKYDIEAGNICMIGDDKEVFDLSCHIISYLEKHRYHLELVTPEQFFRAGRSDDFNNQNYLIHIDPARVSGNRVRVITDHCSTTFISHISSATSVSNRIKYNRIVGSLVKNFSKRKAMLDSLKPNEFLVINKDTEKIFYL